MAANKCETCKFYRDGLCQLPMWKDGEHYPWHKMQPEAGCQLHEERNDALSV